MCVCCVHAIVYLSPWHGYGECAWYFCVIFTLSFNCVSLKTIIILLVIHVNINNQFTYNNYYIWTYTICTMMCHHLFLFFVKTRFYFVWCVFVCLFSFCVVALSVLLIQNELYKFSTHNLYVYMCITNSICRWWSRTFYFLLLLFLRCYSTFSSVE